MTANIDLSDYGADYNDRKGWIPIVDYVSTVQPEYPFSGNFDGNGFKISGLFINNDITPNFATGLFGYVYGGTVKNLGVEVDITGGYRVGGVVGCVNNGSIENCYSTVMVSGGNYVGGVVGQIVNTMVKNGFLSFFQENVVFLSNLIL